MYSHRTVIFVHQGLIEKHVPAYTHSIKHVSLSHMSTPRLIYFGVRKKQISSKLSIRKPQITQHMSLHVLIYPLKHAPK
jgi:hypothetical protein